MVRRPTIVPHARALVLAFTVVPTLSGCLGGIYAGDPPPHKLPPPCVDILRGDWELEGTGGEPDGSATPPLAGTPGFAITRTNVLTNSQPPADLGAYTVTGSAGAAVVLGGLGAAPLRIVCNGEDKIQLGDGPAWARRWFYRRARR